MDLILLLIVVFVLYLLSDRIVLEIERRRGARLESRSLYFFGIMLVLSLIVFNLIEHLMEIN